VIGEERDRQRGDALREHERQRAAIEAALAPLVAAFAALEDPKKAKARTRKRGVLLLHWALACWSKLLAEVMPEAARELAALTGPATGKLEWAQPMTKILDYRMNDRRFDLKQALGEDVAASRLQSLDADLPRRLGIVSLAAAWDRINPKDEPLRDALWYAGYGIRASLELHMLSTGSLPAALEGLEAPIAAFKRALAK
jgi:hypothetical protein